MDITPGDDKNWDGNCIWEQRISKISKAVSTPQKKGTCWELQERLNG